MRPTARARRGAATEVARARRPGGATSTNAPFDARPASGRPAFDARSALDAHSALQLQRTAGNRAAALALRPAPVVQREHIDLAGGGRVSDSDAPGANLRENVLIVIDRLRDLGELAPAAHATEHAHVAALPARSVVPIAQMAATAAALTRASSATLGAPAAETLLHVAIGAGVGWGQPNHKADVAAVQDLLHGQGLLSDDDYGTSGAPGEKAAVEASGATVSPALILRTMAALAAVKRVLLAGRPLPSPLAKGLTGPLAAQEAADIAAFEATKARHDANRVLLRSWIDEGAAQRDSRTLRNSCEWIRSRRTPFFIMTKTHDSTKRATAAGQPAGGAWFSFPAGDLYGSAVGYRRSLPTEAFDNTNVVIRDHLGIGGFQEGDGIAVMESVIASGREMVWKGLKHELQHRADLHGDSDLEGYKTEFRAYWMGSREPDPWSTTKIVRHLGYEWTERQWGIFNALYNSPTYAFVKKAWDAEAGLAPSARVFRDGVVGFQWPTSVNPTNSMRVDILAKAVEATTYADCGAAATAPNAHVDAVMAAARALNRDDRHDIANSPDLRTLLLAHLRGPVLGRVVRAIE